MYQAQLHWMMLQQQNNSGVATANGGFQSSADACDLVLRAINRLILQSGGGGYGILVEYR